MIRGVRNEISRIDPTQPVSNIKVVRKLFAESIALPPFRSLVVGLPAGLALCRLLSRFLFGVTAHDPITFAAVCIVPLAVAGRGSYLPARRAIRVEPMVALRDE